MEANGQVLHGEPLGAKGQQKALVLLGTVMPNAGAAGCPGHIVQPSPFPEAEGLLCVRFTKSLEGETSERENCPTSERS